MNTTKEDLAKAMIRPIRCGGLDYDENGTPMYRIGGRSLTVEEFEKLRLTWTKPSQL